MPATNDSAARLQRAGLIALALGAGTFVIASLETRSDATGTDSSAAEARPSLIMVPNREFAASSYVHEQLPSDAPRDSHSDAWVRELQRQIKAHHGRAIVSVDRYTPPVFVVPADQPTVRVRAERADDPKWTFAPLQRQWERVPFPDGFQPSPGTDKEVVVYQPSTGNYWEFWGTENTGRKTVDSAGRTVDEWRAAWGGKIDNLATNPGYFPTTSEGYKFGTTATSLALLGGLITIAEQRRGEINHALHIALPKTRRGVWAYPAQRTDGAESDANAIPQGATFRIPQSVNLDEIDMDPYARMVARAVQKYGMVVRDTAGAVVLYAENPLSNGADHPYFGIGGILHCPNGRAVASCYPDTNGRLRGFPWDRLEAVQAKLQD